MRQIHFNTRVLGQKAADRLKLHQVTQTLRGPGNSITRTLQEEGLGTPFEVTLDGVVIGQAGPLSMDVVYWQDLDIDDARRGGFDNRFELASALRRAGYRFKGLEEYPLCQIQFVWLESKSALTALAQFWKQQAEVFAEQEKQWHEIALFYRKLKEDIRRR